MANTTSFFKKWYFKLRDFPTENMPLLNDPDMILTHARGRAKKYLKIEPIPCPHTNDKFIGIAQDLHSKACFYYFKTKKGNQYVPLTEGYYDFTHLPMIIPNTEDGFYKVPLSNIDKANGTFIEENPIEIKGVIMGKDSQYNEIMANYNGNFAVCIRNTPSGEDPNDIKLNHPRIDGEGSGNGCGETLTNSIILKNSLSSLVQNFEEHIFTDRNFFYIPTIMETGLCVYYKFPYVDKIKLEEVMKKVYKSHFFKVGYKSNVRRDKLGFYYTEDLFFY